MKTKISSWLWVIAIGISAMSCNKKPENAAQQNEFESENITPVRLSKVEVVHRAEPIFASGLIANTDEARLSFKVGGIIEKIYVKEGQKVSKGQLLATLNLTEINAQVSQAQYGLEKAERDYKRVQSMYKDTAATLEQMQNATTGYDVAKQNLQIARFNQAYSRIVAPISGVVVRKIANEGELTGPGNPVVLLNSSDATDWVVRVGVPDKDWARLKLGDRATIYLDAYPDEVFTGTITELVPIADPMNKLYEVEVKISPNGKRFASGMFAKIELTPIAGRNYTVVPIEAILEGNGKNAYVFVLDASGKHAKKTPVTIGYIEKDKALLSSGLDNIDQVIVGGGAFLRDGGLVK